MSIWSHRCKTSQYKDNSIHGCKQAATFFTGIEVDVRWKNQKFWLDHDDWERADGTLEELLNLQLPVDMLIDMKTSYAESIPRLIQLVQNHSKNIIVEVYDDTLIQPLHHANITTASTHYDTDYRSISGIRWLLFSSDKTPFYSWHLDSFCFTDMFFQNGGTIILTDNFEPHQCDTFPNLILIRVLLWVFIISIVLLIVYGCFKLYTYCTRPRRYKL